MGETLEITELSLFPLNTVLFPGQVLPLHIFEERYRLMIRNCLAEDKPFGVVLIRRGAEVGENAEPHQVGTSARILESTHLADGTMNIVSVGTDRFRIKQLIHDQPYLRGAVEGFPLQVEVAPESLAELALKVRGQVSRYIALISEAAGLQIQVGEMPEGAQQVGFLAAVAMQIDNKEKQRLLGCSSLDAILLDELTLLHRENALLTWMRSSKDWPQGAQFGPSGTLLPN